MCVCVCVCVCLWIICASLEDLLRQTEFMMSAFEKNAMAFFDLSRGLYSWWSIVKYCKKLFRVRFSLWCGDQVIIIQVGVTDMRDFPINSSTYQKHEKQHNWNCIALWPSTLDVELLMEKTDGK
jgi:hypothetical protein